ncbi:MAG: hypothetical protein SFU98_00190, partial [Leptospiraceae bacterium]|nr:hypothetical protein [Leptospiraceae bacterium]
NNAACPLVITGGETNTIFTFTSGTGSYNINSTCFLNSPKLSFVVDPKIQITQNSGGYILVSNNSNHFTLLEGRINGAGGLGLAIDTTGGPNFIVGRNLRVYNTSVSLFNFRTTSIFSYFKNLIVANNSAAMGKGLVVANFASRNIFDGVSSFNNNDEGVSLEGGNSNIFLNTISSSNNINGIRFSSASSSNNKFLSLTSSLNSLTGITFSAGATQNYFMNSLVTNNNSGSNTGLSMTIGGIDTTLLNLSSNNNNTGSDSQIASSGTAGGNRRFMGTLRVSLNNCIGSGFNEDGINNSCIATGLSDFVSPGIINFQSGNNPFISGTPKSNSDSVNPSFSSSGIATIGSIGSNWTNFQNFYRTIALSMGNAFPHPSLVGRCTTNCQLYDWSFSKSDASGLRNILRCPLNLARPTLDLYGPVILRNAVEILGDWKGNDDGLCNSNEECIYTPNIGAYQGHGKLVPASTANDSYPNATNQCADITTASGSDGTVNNIKLFKYEKNGY